MSRSSHRRYSIKKFFLKILQCSKKSTCVPVKFLRTLWNTEIFLRTTVLKKICERLLLIVVFSRNEQQHLLARVDEMVCNIIMFFIYSFHFGIIILLFYPEAVLRRYSFKDVLKDFAKFTWKHLYWGLFFKTTLATLWMKRLRHEYFC